MSQMLDDVPSEEAEAAILKAAAMASTGSDSGRSDIKEDDYSSSLAATDDDDGSNQQIVVKAPSPSIVSPWEQFNKSMRREIFSNERPTWRTEWFGVHLPPSAVARGSGGPTVDDDSVVGYDAATLLPNPTTMVENVGDDEHDDLDASNDVEVEEVEVQHPSKPIPTEPTFQSPPPAEISLSSLLLQLASSEGPSIPLYPLLILLTTIYLIKKILQCLFSYKSRTQVKRSINKVVFWKRHNNQFTISQEELVRHLDWMKRRGDLRREREKQKKQKKKKNVDKKESTNKDRDDFDKDDGRGSGGEGRYDNARGNSDGGSGDGGGHQNHDENNDDGDHSSSDSKYNNNNGNDQKNNHLGLSEKERYSSMDGR